MQSNIDKVLTAFEEVVFSIFEQSETKLRPGLGIEQLREAEVRLLPYYLPNELRHLYMWHDGADEPITLMPGFRFLSFDKALELYRLRLKLDGGTEGWNPLWFPVLEAQGDVYCVTLSPIRHDRSSVYFSCNQDTDLFVVFPDLETFISYSTNCYHTGAFFLDGDFVEVNEDQAQEIARHHGSPFPEELVDGVTVFSKFSTAEWPTEWQNAVGRGASEVIGLAPPHQNLRAFRASRDHAVISAKVVAMIGSESGIVIKVCDESGHMTVWCPKSAFGYRELQIGNFFEFIVKPISREESIPEIASDCEAKVERLTPAAIIRRELG